MIDSTSIYFTSIIIEGYRGRKFELEMKPKGQHSVFIMDGNTGKTTTIELLRWCFIWKNSEAKGKFRHMWENPAHLLDNKIKGKQNCSITINFSSEEHDYSFTRTTIGEYLWEKDHDGKVLGDKIESIKDELNIDNGGEYLDGDSVHRYLNDKFKLNQCAEYFCFDGEKAREFMKQSADAGKVDLLLKTIEKRSKHPKLQKYKESLEDLQNKIYTASSSKVSDRSLKLNIQKILKEEGELREIKTDIAEIEDDIQVYTKQINDLIDQKTSLEDEKINKKSENLLKRTNTKNEIKFRRDKIQTKRSSIYNNCLDWISLDINDAINQIKSEVKEKGKLPEPFREELIETCLENKPPTCIICSRKLDELSMKRVKNLGELIASHNVQNFLTQKFENLEITSFDPKKEDEEIQELIKQHEDQEIYLKSIDLSDEDEQILEDLKKIRDLLSSLEETRIELRKDKESLVELQLEKEKTIASLKQKDESLKGYKIILDAIEKALETIHATESKMNDRILEIISDVISESVTSILGPKFSSILSKDSGLLLGEDGYYSNSAGGMSGRLILSYCFAESMTFIDPIIIDTPSGNVGSHRLSLAEHLKANHDQVILLCLPTEIDQFAPVLSKETKIITNLEKVL